MSITIPNPLRVIRRAGFVPRWTQGLAILVVTSLLAFFQWVLFEDGHAVATGVECRADGEPTAGERISLPLRCVDAAGNQHAYATNHAATVLLAMRSADRPLRCDVMASGRVANCRE